MKRPYRQGTLWNGIVQLLFAFLPMLIGMCAYAAFPDLGNQELALPKANEGNECPSEVK